MSKSLRPGAASTKSRRAKCALVPQVSATVAKLIATIQAEAEAATLEALSAKDGILVLQPIESGSAHFSDYGETLVFRDTHGAAVRYYQRLELPEKWRGSELERTWHPSHFRVYVTRVDGEGRQWGASLGIHVTDEFGTLVAVPE